MSVIDFIYMLIRNLVSEPDMVRVKKFETGEGDIIEILVSEKDIGKVIGVNGRIARALKIIIQVKAYEQGLSNLRVNIDSF